MRWILLLLALGCAAGATDIVDADLKVLFLIDDESHLIGDDIDGACLFNRDRLHQNFREAAKAEEKTYQAWAMQGHNLDGSAIQTFLRKLPVKRTDTLLVYYCGHGVMEPGNRHLFQTSGGNIPRSLIQRELVPSLAKQTILMSDTCSAKLFASRPRLLWEQPQQSRASEILRDLLFRSSGRTDITAANPPELAWFSPAGGVFTHSFIETVLAPRESLDLNRDGRVSWSEIFTPLAVATATGFRNMQASMPAGHKIHNQKSQTPAVWAITD